MAALSLYLLKVNVVGSLLFLVYFLLLRKEKFFQLNRLFLLGTMLSAILLPFAPSIPVFPLHQLQNRLSDYNPLAPLYHQMESRPRPPESLVEMPMTKVSDQSTQWLLSELPWSSILLSIYGSIVLIRVVRLGLQLFRAVSLIRKSTRYVSEGVHYCLVEEKVSPFSFFHYLISHASQPNSATFAAMVAHEKVHMQQGHTLDILLVELIHCLLWANPFWVVLKQAVKLNLEYLADSAVLASGIDRKYYQYSLLHVCLETTAFPLALSFRSSKLKSRIAMMNSGTTSLQRLYKYVLALSLFGATYLIIHPSNARAWQEFSKKKTGLALFEGYYQSKDTKDVYIHISSQGNRLRLTQLWDGKQVLFEQESELAFIEKQLFFPLTFTKAKDGSISQAIAFGRDVWVRVKSIGQ